MTSTNLAPAAEVLPPVDLPALARKISAEHRAIVDAAKGVVIRAIAAGEALIQAKAAVPDGQWLRWLSTTTVSERTAQLYMQLAEYKRQLEAEANYRPATIADQTLNEAIRSMRAKKKSEKKSPPKPEPPASVVLGGMDAPPKSTPSLDDYIQNTAADELFRVLCDRYEAAELSKLADLLRQHLTPAST